jgi:LysR family glycine cleavage system transcriptional activator
MSVIHATLEYDSMQLLPHSLTAIRIFDAAARHLSCSRAADELFLTQSAVSKQLHSLEEYLGVALFTRVHQGLILTEAGKIYWDAIRPALLALADATAKIRSMTAAETTISLGVPATLGQQWFIPRLPAFAARHPEVLIQISPRLVTDATSNVLTAEIRYGRGNWPGMHSHYLLGRELYLVCSSGLANSETVGKPVDLLKFRLMEHVQLPNTLERWFANHGVDGYDQRATQRYEQFSVMIPALLAGLGVGILPRFLIEDELRLRRLKLLFKEPLESDSGYYLVYSKDKSISKSMEKFKRWLLEEAKEDRTVSA